LTRLKLRRGLHGELMRRVLCGRILKKRRMLSRYMSAYDPKLCLPW